MGILQIVSQRPQAGKTSLAAALCLTLAQAGKTAGYYKPVSAQPDTDPDVAFIREEILKPSAGPEVPSPLGLDPSSSVNDSQAQQIQNNVSGLHTSQGRVLLEGPDLETPKGRPSHLAGEVSTLTGSRVVLLFRYTKDLGPEEILQASEVFGERLAGVIINCVTKHRLAGVQQTMATGLGSQNVALLGVLPELRIMQAPTVQQVADTLGGRWVQEPTDGGVPVERILIGGNIMDSGPEYYGRYESQAVIARSQRPDIHLACLVPGTKCLVLTEGGEPTDYIKAEAMQRQVPVMIVQTNTLEAAEALTSLVTGSSAHNLARVRGFTQHLEAHLDLDRLAALAE